MDFPKEFTRVKPSYLTAFFSSFQDWLINGLENLYYFDMLAIFLSFASGLSELLSLASFSRAFLSPNLFHRDFSIFREIPLQIEIFRDVFFDVVSKASQALCFDLLVYCGSRSPWLFAEMALAFLLHLSDFQLELFSSEKLVAALISAALLLQELYLTNPTDQCYQARLACFSLMFAIVHDSAAFPLASSSSCFAAGYIRMLFEPDMTEHLLSELRRGFMNCHCTDLVPFFLQFIPAFCSLLDWCANHSNDPDFTRLASLLIGCLSSSLTNKPLLIHSFKSAFTPLLNYVFTVPDWDLMRDCFTFLSTSAECIPQFHFSADMFRLLIDLMGKVEGSDPSESTRMIIMGLLSGTGHRRADSLFLIKHPVFIPLVLAAYRQSSQLIDVIEHFTALCQHSASNCIACHAGDLDFLLLELLAHRDHAFSFYGYSLAFAIDDTSAFPAILSLVCLIMKVHTSTMVIDRLVRLALPTPDFRPELSLVLDRLNTFISADSKRRSPVFDMRPRRPQCEVTGLTGAMLNPGFTLSFWLNVDTAQLLQSTEVFFIFRLISADGRVTFRVFANNGNLFIAATNEESTVHGQFWASIPGGEWIPFTVSAYGEPGDQTIVSFYRNRESAPLTPFPRFEFPPGEVRLLIGGSDAQDDTGPSPGRIGPFAVHCGGAALATFVNYPFHSDPNFEHFHEAVFTTDLIAHPQQPARFKFERCRECIGHDFLETIATDYDLNYLTWLLLSFKKERVQCPIAFLKMILGFISYSKEAQHKFFSVPCLAMLLPSILPLTYQVYSIFFAFISGCLDEQLLHEMLDHIILNIEIWMRADFQCVTRILHHWTSAIIPTFRTGFLRRWTVRRLLAVFGILFLPIVERDGVSGPEVATQVGLTGSLNEQCAVHAFSIFHSPEETAQARELYEQYIIAVGQLRLTACDLDSLYSYFEKAEAPSEKLIFLNLIVRLGTAPAQLPDLAFDPILPLRPLFALDSVDSVIPAAIAVSVLAGKNVHLMLSVMSTSILPNCRAVLFRELLARVADYPNLFSLICLLALSLDARAKEQALNLMDILCSDAAMCSGIVACEFSWIWPIALGLAVGPQDIEKIASFISMLIFHDSPPLERFEAVLSMVELVAGDSRSDARDRLSAAITLVVSRDVFSLPDERNSRFHIPFLLSCFRSLYFQPFHALHTRSLLECVSKSPFATDNSPIKESQTMTTFSQFLDKCANRQNLGRSRRFGLRLNATGEWIDNDLSGTLCSHIPAGGPSHVLLSHYVFISTIFKRARPDFTQFAPLHRSVEFLIDHVQFPTDQCRAIERCQSSDFFSFCLPEKIADQRRVDMQNELRRLDDLVAQSRTTIRHIQKDIVSHRNSAVFSEEVIYERENCRCFSFCPSKVHPKFNSCQKTWRPWEALDGDAVQVGDVRPVRTSVGETVPCRWYRAKGIRDVEVWFSPREMVITNPDSTRSSYIPFRDITRVLKRDPALELFVKDGSSFLLDFAPVPITEILTQMTLSDDTSVKPIDELTKEWLEFRLSTFSYLMHLNMLAGRSFDDLSHYPVLPNLFEHGDRNLERDYLSGMTPSSIVRMLARICPFTALYFHDHGKDISHIIRSFDELTNVELPAEFFFQPEIFIDSNKVGFADFRLPEPRHDFIYRQRKLLESDKVSSQLHHWVDLVFGAQLFSDPHIARPIRQPLERQVFTHSASASSIVFAGRVASGDIWIVDAQLDLHGFRIDLSDSNHISKTDTIALPLFTNAVFALTENGILTYERHSGRLRFFGNPARFEGEILDVNELVSQGSRFVTVRNRTILTLFDLTTFPNPIMSIAATEDVILCLAMSQTFQILCTATRDDRLHIFSLKNLRQTHSVLMPKSSARSMLVTPTWGHIAVDLGAEILLFSINGDFLTSYAHDCQFSYITAITSPDDFDYIVFADVKGTLSMFEAYVPTNRFELARLVFPVCFIDYDRQGDWLLVVSPAGKILLIIHPFSSIE
jgi:hypothetical protein